MPNTNYILTPEGIFLSENELYHHGIKGMKWGVRRYQNEDGTLTSAGKKRQWDKTPEGYSIAHQIKEDKMRHAIANETDRAKKKQLKKDYKELVKLGKQKAEEYRQFENDMHKKVGKISKVTTTTDANGHKTYTNKKRETLKSLSSKALEIMRLAKKSNLSLTLSAVRTF